LKSFDAKEIRIIEIIIILCLCFIPILWFRNGYFYANGDDFPLFLNSHQTLETGASMWSPNYLGYATPMSAYLLYQYIGAFFSTLGLSVGAIQTIFLVSLFIIAGFSMFYLTNIIYPKSKVGPFIASFFYIFNFFFLINMRNIGFRWTYAFLPLIFALFFKIMVGACQNDKKTTNTNIIYFALVSIIAFSFASINPANIALFIIGLSVMALYFLAKFRKQIKPYLFSIAKTFGATFLVNLWWLIPVLNSFVFSGQALNSQVSINAWSWTQVRSSFLNLFWLNGSWNWSQEYYPFANVYSDIFLQILVFVPFLIAASALLFKGNKARFNAFLMAIVLVFLFLAKGLHEPLRQVNLLLYQYFPLMSMFREPVSKFTIVMLPFLALLIGYGSERLVNIRLPKINVLISKTCISAFLVIVLLVSVSPILLNSMETKSAELPFSSQVKIPDYWYQATDWINTQPGDWKVLLTPLDDFYQMPYAWGYYGTDQLLERLFEKPIVSTADLNGYVSNSNASLDLLQIRASVKFNHTDEFKALMDLLNIKYIVQRNDVQTQMIGRNLMSANDMQAFFAEQPYLKLVKSFGKIDIYEYTEAKPSLYAIQSSTLQTTNVSINVSQTLNKKWFFSSANNFSDWKNCTPSNQSQATCIITQEANHLEADFWNLTSGWVIVNSPVFSAESESHYLINANFSARNDLRVDLQIAEYSENMTVLSNFTFAQIEYGHGTFDNWIVPYSFEPKNEDTKYFQIQFWNYYNVKATNKSSLLLNEISVIGTTSVLNFTGLENLYSSGHSVLTVQNISPTEIEAEANTTEPFILATTQYFDNSWSASVNGIKLEPVSLYLGLKGFQVNTTGQFTITLKYEPQALFNCSLTISFVATLLAFVTLLYINRHRIKDALNYDH
jgi:hypothetical protein